VAHLPSVSALFAALLGYNPIRTLLAPAGVLRSLPAGTVAVLTGRQFFPHLITGAFHRGLVTVFTAAAAMALTGSLVSSLRGGQYYYEEQEGPPSSPGPDTAAMGGWSSSTSRPLLQAVHDRPGHRTARSARLQWTGPKGLFQYRTAGLCAAAASKLATPCDRLSRHDLRAVASPLAPATARLAYWLGSSRARSVPWRAPHRGRSVRSRH
jgi:hypothetical protein